jgi:uncharacterized protein (DUF58 family)
MIRVTGVGRRVLIGVVALGAMALGWVLLYQITSPGVAAKLSTAPLAVVIALQILPILGWAAWRLDRSVRVVNEDPAPHPAPKEIVHVEAPIAASTAAAGERVGRVGDVVPVYRVVHVARSRQRALSRDNDEVKAP